MELVIITFFEKIFKMKKRLGTPKFGCISNRLKSEPGVLRGVKEGLESNGPAIQAVLPCRFL